MANFYQPKKQVRSIPPQHQSVRIEKQDHQGAGIGYINKKPVFVEGALPNETALVQLTEVKSKYSRAKLIRIQEASPHRVAAFCSHYQTCGGCHLQHMNHKDQIRLKSDALHQMMLAKSPTDLHLSPPIIGASLAYRRRAKIAVKWNSKTQSLDMGFRQKNSNVIVNIDDCPLLVPQLNALLPAVRSVLSTFSKPKEIGHLEWIFDGNKVGILLRYTGQLPVQDHTRWLQFCQDKQITAYLLNNDNILNCLCGDALEYQETGYKIRCLPTDFIQVNAQINQAMVEQAIDWLDVNEDEQVLDLFCGVGNFSLALASKVKQVVGVEGVEDMVMRARHNAQWNQLTNIAFYQADLSQTQIDAKWAQSSFDKVILDPARAGASGIIEYIAKLGAKAVVYVSCNPATLARDSLSLYQQGYALSKLAMIDMFPHTSHLESMALFIKTKK